MKFIEATNAETDGKVLIAVEKIVIIEAAENGAVIMLRVQLFKKGWADLTINVKESYEEIKSQIFPMGKLQK